MRHDVPCGGSASFNLYTAQDERLLAGAYDSIEGTLLTSEDGEAARNRIQKFLLWHIATELAPLPKAA
jgi:hypothetical protein